MFPCQGCDNKVSYGGGRITIKMTQESWHLCADCFKRFNELELARDKKLLVEKIVPQDLIQIPRIELPKVIKIPFYKRRELR